MAAVTSEIGELFDAHSANLLQKDGESWRTSQAGGTAGTRSRGSRERSSRTSVTPPAAGRARSLRPERVDSPDELGDELARELWRTHGTQGSSLAAPIIVDRVLWGVISVSRTTEGEVPAGRRIPHRLGDFAALAAQAIANAGAQAEVRESRARLVAAADEERKLERNLHDGAQQRLVSLSLSLRLAQAKLESTPDDGARLSAAPPSARARARRAARARARHPSRRCSPTGASAPALPLADRSPVPVTIESELDERLPRRSRPPSTSWSPRR